MVKCKDMHSSSPARTPKFQPAVEQPSTGGYWNPPRKDTPCPKTKEKRQQNGRRGAIMIKPNPIPGGQAKLKNNNTKVLPLLWKFWDLHQASQLEIHQWDQIPKGIWLWRPVRLNYGISTGLGETETRDQIANIRWIIKKVTEFQKNIYFCFTDYAKAFECVDHKKLWKILKEMGMPDHMTCPPEKSVCRSRSNS